MTYRMEIGRSLYEIYRDWREQGRRWDRNHSPSPLSALMVNRPKPKLPDPPGREIKGHWVIRDWYRWFICTYDRGVIWFYRSDVNAIRLRPEPVITIAPPPLLPERRWVEMFVDPEAREHPEGKDW